MPPQAAQGSWTVAAQARAQKFTWAFRCCLDSSEVGMAVPKGAGKCRGQEALPLYRPLSWRSGTEILETEPLGPKD